MSPFLGRESPDKSRVCVNFERKFDDVNANGFRVRLAAIAVLSEAPEGTNTATQPLLQALEDNDRAVRNAAADTLANLLARNDLKQKLNLVRLVAQYAGTQAAIGTGCNVGSKYMSLEVGIDTCTITRARSVLHESRLPAPLLSTSI